MCIRVLLDCQIKGFEYKLVVVPANCKGNDISTLQVQNGTEIGFPALRAIFHFCNIGAPFLVYGVGCEFSVQNILDSYFRLRPLVCRMFSADDSKQAENMYQTIEPFQVVLFFMGRSLQRLCVGCP